MHRTQNFQPPYIVLEAQVRDVSGKHVASCGLYARGFRVSGFEVCALYAIL